MPITVSELATQCQQLPSATPGPKGRAKVAAILFSRLHGRYSANTNKTRVNALVLAN